jgi:diguanylate cyclase (GGDEF)-like protein
MQTHQCFDRHSLCDYLASIISADDKNSALIMVDVKHTRQISAHHGHLFAEKILALVGDQLAAFVKDPHHLVQSGIHEFALILPNIHNSGHCQLALNRFLRDINGKHINLENITTKTKIVIGAALYPSQSSSINELVQNVEIALHHAELENLPSVMFSRELSEQIVSQIKLESELDIAIKHHALELWYQPKLDLQTGKLFGVEALARWKTRAQGFISPEIFIPLSEQRGFIFDLTRWALNTAFRNQQEWMSDGLELNMAVNLSGKVIEDPEFVELISHTKGIWSTVPSMVTLEVTETSMMHSMEASFDKLTTVRDMGFNLSIDDFGTGYSSLEYFKQLPVDELKIDKSFIKHMLSEKADQSVVSMIINLASTFNMSIVAEGIEDGETLTELTKLGVDKGQGYFIAKPMPEKAFRVWAKDFLASN